MLPVPFVRGSLVLLAVAVGTSLAGSLIVRPFEREREFAADQNAALQKDIWALQERIALFSSVEAEGGEETLPSSVAYASENGGDAEILLQQDVIAQTEAAGIMPHLFGPATMVTGATSLDRVGFDLEFETGLPALVAFLAGIEAHQPRIVIESLGIRQLAPREDLGETPVSVRISVWSFWQKSEEG